MFKQKYFSLVTLCFMLLFQNLFSQIIFQGTVTDNGGEYLGKGAKPVVNALVTLRDEADTNRSFSAYTNVQGQYEIQITETGVDDIHSQPPEAFNLLQNYPNPFNPSTVIGYNLSQAAHIRIEIYNVMGQKIKTLLKGIQPRGRGQIIWDGTDNGYRGVSAGVYIYSLSAEGIRISRKMLLLDGHQNYSNMAKSQTLLTDVPGPVVLDIQTSDQYTLQITGDDIKPHEEQNLTIADNMVHDVTVYRTLTDIEGNVYGTVRIGKQWWMAENLKVLQYSNGDSIPWVTKSQWKNIKTPAYCAYTNEDSIANIYGYLYNWWAVVDSRNIAPEGWHVPTDDEWKTLIHYLGGPDVAGGKLKEAGTAHWESPNTGATNESGFCALPAGVRSRIDGSFGGLHEIAYFWTSTESYDYGAWYRELHYHNTNTRCGELYRYISKRYGFSLRLVRDD